MAQPDHALLDELVRLRHGAGLSAANLRRRIGSRLARFLDLPAGATDGAIRARVHAAVDDLTAGFEPADRMAVVWALGGRSDIPHRTLSERAGELAGRLHYAPRTARRRIDDAFRILAGEIATRLEQAAVERDDDPEKGWYVRRIDALLRLDTPAPELIEKRTIVSTRAGLTRIQIRYSVPRGSDPTAPLPDMTADIQQGARIESVTPDGEGHFRLLLQLPTVLGRDDEHTYTIMFHLSDRRFMRHHYAVVPLVDCDELRVRARFDPAEPPRTVWRLDRVPPRPLAGRPIPGPPLALDGVYEVELAFTGLERGYGYGVAWATGADPIAPA